MSSSDQTSGASASWIKRLSPTCEDSVRLLSRALDQDLPWLSKLGLRLHLVLCRWCRRYARQIRFLRLAFRQTGDDPKRLPEAYLSPEARRRIERALSEAAREPGT